jgi:FkbM family methyltransferase
VTGYKLDNLTLLTENNAIGNVVTAGFWESDVIAALLAGAPQKLIIFEPDNALYAQAKANYADESNVEVRNATLSEKTGEADYFVFTPNRFSSLLKPKQLLKIYRKNSNDNVTSINVSTVQSVCEQQKILPSAGNILLLGVNCPSSILSDAAQTDHLSYFDVIIVRQPKQGLYESEQQQEALNTVLQENKFNVLQELSHDPMYTQFVFGRDHRGEKINALQAKVTATESRNAEVSKQLAETESRASQFESSATELNSNYSKLKAEYEGLTANVSALEIKGTELATQNTQLDTALTQTKAQYDKLSAGSAEKQTANEQMAAQVIALQNKQNELAGNQKNKDDKIAELTKQRDQQTQGQQETKQRAEALKGQNEQLLAQVAALQTKQNELSETQKNKDAKIAELAAQRDQQAKGHQETKQQAESLKAQNEKLSADRAQKLTENEQSAAQVTALQAKHNELTETQKNKDAKIAELAAQRDQQAKGHQETKHQAESLKAQNDKLSAVSAQQQTEKEQLAAQVTALQAKHNELAKTQKNKDAKIAELAQQREQQAQGHQETKQLAVALKVENETRTAESAQQQTVIEQLTVQVNVFETKQNELVETQKNKDDKIAKLTAQRDQQAKGHQETRQQAESLKAKNDELSTLSTQKQTENEQLTAQVAALQNKQNQLAESHKNKDAQIAELTAQRDQQTQEHQETKQLAEALKVENETLTAASAQQQTVVEQLTAQVNVFETKQHELVEGQKNKEAQIAELTKLRDQKTHENQETKQRAERLNQQCEELKVYSAARQKSADLALKLQTKAQIDLDDLREKYQHKHINEQKLVALISELRAKLQQAAEYYYELQAKHPELNEVTQNQVEPSNIENYGTAPVEAIEKKTRPAKRKKRSKQAKSVTRGKL